MKISIEEADARIDRKTGSLSLNYTGVTGLPDGLTVGGRLILYGTKITELPAGLAVGDGIIGTRGTRVEGCGVRELRDGDYREGEYLYANGILTHVRAKTQTDGYTAYIGKVPGRNVVSDGRNYVFCDSLPEGIDELVLKPIYDRGNALAETAARTVGMFIRKAARRRWQAR